MAGVGWDRSWETQLSLARMAARGVPIMAQIDNDESDVAVMEPQVIVRPKPKRPDPETKQKKQPPYAVILHNDDDHTFQYVIDLLMKLFAYPLEKEIGRASCRERV